VRVVVSGVPDDFDLNAGVEIEVLGFVHYGYELRAVWRDDDGYVSSVPTAFIRMLPNTADSVRKQDAETLGVGVLG
jgi:hypothetical protein